MPKTIAAYASNFNGKMLDFGCGHKPYKSLFPHVDEYIGVDFNNEGHNHEKEEIDVYYDGNSLPFPDNYFDCAICTEVLEHVPDIDKSLGLLRRVLKRDARIILTVPFIWSEHEMPFDFRRFTMNGLVEKLKEHGFEVIKTHKNGNYISVIMQLYIIFIHDLLFVKNIYINFLINFIFVFPVTLAGIILSPVFFRYQSLYFNNIVLAVKKD
ncbi:MAG: class I SAM-dependent methyltransferase [Dysgonamonadaceae bacterium]|nr:class I SAM-dependent methyltransferase [Dysgonamonadaceae bacterium]